MLRTTLVLLLISTIIYHVSLSMCYHVCYFLSLSSLLVLLSLSLLSLLLLVVVVVAVLLLLSLPPAVRGQDVDGQRVLLLRRDVGAGLAH